MIIANDYRKMMVYHNLWFENKFKIKVKVKKWPKLIENKILKKKDLNVDINQFEDTVLRANKKFQNHTSVRAFKENNKDNQLTFESIFMPDIKKRL